MKLLSYTLIIQTKRHSYVSQTLSPSVVSGKHSQEHQPNIKNTFVNFGTLLKFLKNQTRYGFPLPLKALKKNPNLKDLPSLPIYEPMASEAPNTSAYNRKKVPKGKKHGAKIGHKKKSTSLSTKSNPMSKIEATKVAGVHKEDQQATGGPTSLGVTSEEGANPQLNSRHDVSVDFTAEVDLGKSAPNDSISK
ncbi:hypothetical protein Tco_0522990 [Tanacetum coccineum]